MEVGLEETTKIRETISVCCVIAQLPVSSEGCIPTLQGTYSSPRNQTLCQEKKKDNALPIDFFRGSFWVTSLRRSLIMFL